MWILAERGTEVAENHMEVVFLRSPLRQAGENSGLSAGISPARVLSLSELLDTLTLHRKMLIQAASVIPSSALDTLFMFGTAERRRFQASLCASASFQVPSLRGGRQEWLAHVTLG